MLKDLHGETSEPGSAPGSGPVSEGRLKVSERRACRVVGQNRSAQRYAACRTISRRGWSKRCAARRGASAVGLSPDPCAAGRRRLEGQPQTDRAAVAGRGLRVPPRREAPGQRPGQDANCPGSGRRPGHIWSYDFMSLRTDDGPALRLLNVVDEYTRFGSVRHRPLHRGPPMSRPLEPLFAAREAGDDPQRQRQGVHLHHPGAWLARAGRRPPSRSRKPARSRTATSNGSTAPCATSSSTGSCSTPWSKPGW